MCGMGMVSVPKAATNFPHHRPCTMISAAVKPTRQATPVDAVAMAKDSRMP